MIECGIHGCLQPCITDAIIHVILNDIQHTFGVCARHKNLVQLDLVRPVKIEDRNLVIEALPAAMLAHAGRRR